MGERMRSVGITLIATVVVSLATLPPTHATSRCDGSSEDAAVWTCEL